MKILKAMTLASVLTLAACGGGGEQDGARTEESGEGESQGVAAVPPGGLFEMQPGLWERKILPTSGAVPPAERICIDEATRVRVTPATEVRNIVGGCQVVEQSEPTPFGVIFRLQCSQPKATEVGGNSKLENGVLTTDLNLAEGGQDEGGLPAGVKIETRRIGDCPAGVNPGDVSDVTGKVTGSING